MINVETRGLRYAETLRAQAVPCAWMLALCAVVSVLTTCSAIPFVLRPVGHNGWYTVQAIMSGGWQLLYVVTGVLWLRWLTTAFDSARALAAPGVRTPNTSAVLSFIIPLASLIWPMFVMKELHDGLAPELLPEAPTRAASDGVGGYRDQAARPAAALPARAPLALWWGLWVSAQVLPLALNILGVFVGAFLSDRGMRGVVVVASISTATSSLLKAVAAVFAVQVLTQITARMAFRERRMTELDVAKWGPIQS